MQGVLISVEFARHLREYCVCDVADVAGILQLHDDYIPATLHSFRIVTGRVRLSRNNEPAFFENLVVNRSVIRFLAQFGDAVVIGLLGGARQNVKSNSKAAVNRYETICVGVS